MQTIHVKDEVSKAVGRQWEDFAKDHPSLAAVMDRDLLIEEATAKLADDPAFQQALAEAGSSTLAINTLADLFDGFVKKWLAKLIG